MLNRCMSKGVGTMHKISPIMLALHLMLFSTYYAQDYDGIIGAGPTGNYCKTEGVLLLSDDFCYTYMHSFIQLDSQVLHSVVPGLRRLTISLAI